MDTRWNIKVSEETDRDLRTFLAQKGMKRGSLSRFVESAVETQLFRAALKESREANTDLSDEELEALVDEAATWARQRK